MENRSDCPINLYNIGNHGENLTIAVLSMNRVSQTVRLLESIHKQIPDYQGKVLLGDNGSEAEELQKLKEALKRFPFECHVIEFGKNYGVARGRNKLFAEVKTDWLMSLDNDLYFTSNPLPQVQQDIGVLGCKFLSMPLLDKGDKNSGIYGGHLYVEQSDGKPTIGVGSACIVGEVGEANVPHPGFLCSGLPGTAAVINKEAFFTVGGFDNAMFVGFEDTEFSIRLFQKGYKVGSCGMISLEHDHQKTEKKTDRNYERQRFSQMKLQEAAQHFERKHGLHIWTSSVAQWVKERQRTLAINDINKETKIRFKKAKIAMVIDRPDWALDHIADHVICDLSDEFDFQRIYVSDIDNTTDVFLLAEDCDIIHFLWRGNLALFAESYAQQRILNLGLSPKEFYDRYQKGKIISTEVYDHLLLEGSKAGQTEWLFKNKNSLLTNYAVSSRKLKELYDTLPGLQIRPQAVLEDGVDLHLFKPQNLERFENIKNRTIRFGWVGNSKWQEGDLKGLRSIIRPAIEQLKEEGYPVELITSDRDQGMLPHHRMPQYYAGIDCYICASIHEGTPNPILEAMACGVPVISTDVGLVPEVFGKQQEQFILPERSVDCLKQAIIKLLKNPGCFSALSEENLHSIQPWSWEKRTEFFRQYFDECLESAKDRNTTDV